MLTDTKYIITEQNSIIESFLLQDSEAVEIHLDDPLQESLIGSIYIARVKDIVKQLDAAFVEIAPGQICYLPLEDVSHPIFVKKGMSKNIQQGDELVVQVCRDGIKTKYPSVTTNLTFHGKYILLTSGNQNLSVSSKLAKTERESLKQFLREETSEYENCGWLIRTNASGIDLSLLRKEMQQQYRQYRDLVSAAMHRTCFTCLRQNTQTWLKRLTDLYKDAASVYLTDSKALYEQIMDYLKIHDPEDIEKVSFYQDSLLPLKKKYSLEHKLEEALQERVWLKCGGYLIIQPTEALTVIDVNSGKFESKKKKEDYYLKVNLEASKEIARQIRLRNLSGIIIVDFINMDSDEAVTKLLMTLEQYLKQDPVPVKLVDMTKLSLVEITRQKKEAPLHERWKNTYQYV